MCKYVEVVQNYFGQGQEISGIYLVLYVCSVLSSKIEFRYKDIFHPQLRITKKGMRTRIIVQRCQKIFPMQRLLFVEICHTYKHIHVLHSIIVVENVVMTFPKIEREKKMKKANNFLKKKSCYVVSFFFSGKSLFHLRFSNE